MSMSAELLLLLDFNTIDHLHTIHRCKTSLQAHSNSIWTGGPKCSLRVFAKYIKDGLTDVHQTLRLLRELHRPSFEIEDRSLIVAMMAN